MKWTVYMKVERLISVQVEAETQEEARAKAKEWDIIGDEREDHTISVEITRAVADSQ
jgi:hypothetical protein